MNNFHWLSLHKTTAVVENWMAPLKLYIAESDVPQFVGLKGDAKLLGTEVQSTMRRSDWLSKESKPLKAFKKVM